MFIQYRDQPTDVVHYSILPTYEKMPTCGRRGGVGIDPATSKRLANLMGDEIWLESRIGQGSTFYFKVSGTEPAEPVRRSMAS